MKLPPFDSIRVIAFDADDTLWECEMLFQDAKKFVCELLSEYMQEKELQQKILTDHVAKLDLYGYGVKGYILSLVETALDVSNQQLTQAQLAQLVELGKRMLNYPVTLLPDVKEVLLALKKHYKLIIITKGDLLDQQRKLNLSGLSDFFDIVEVVSEKDEKTYQKVLDKWHILPDEFLMVGNSLKSDILPIIALGGHAMHVPHTITWEHEQVDLIDHISPKLYTCKRLRDVLTLTQTSTKEI